MIAIIDYGVGNLRSVQKAFAHIGFDAVITGDPAVITAAPAVVLPGVGAFYDCMENIRKFNLAETVRTVIKQGKPLLGICVGLQILFTEGEEDGLHQGLGVFSGRVKRITGEVKVPHMGWNQLKIKRDVPLLRGVDRNAYMYFVHSYHADPCDPGLVVATTDYGQELTAVVARDNVYGVQFHPEKSGRAGLQILQNFGELV